MNNSTKQSALFSLKTYDLPLTPGTNSIGTLNNAQRSSMTWTNVDIKTIVGTMWEKYEYFIITLVSAISAPITAVPTNIFDRTAIINLQGLQFINSSYSIASKSNSPLAQIGTSIYTTINAGTLTQNNFMSGNRWYNIDWYRNNRNRWSRNISPSNLSISN
jgi:hypothetical protein